MDCNKLYYGDNFDILREHIEDNSVDLIYIDPPFNSKRDYNIIYPDATAQATAFSDIWSLKNWQEEKDLIFYQEVQRYSKIHKIIESFEGLLLNSNPSLFAYLVYMSIRIVEMHRVLKDTGSFYLHCDPNASHYLKIILDEIFGNKNFKNEIIWHYRRWTNVQNQFQRMHDVILFYSKSPRNYFKSLKTEMSESQKKKFERGYDSNVIHTNENSYSQLIVYDEEKCIKAGIDFTKYEKIIQKEQPEVAASDVIILPPINSQAKERLGYPTQKPEALLERIIKASCPEDGIVLDAYCGCGTSIAVAQRLKRKWIGIDITFLSIDLIRQRFMDSFYNFGEDKLQKEAAKKQFDKEITIFGMPQDIEGARQLARETKNDKVRKEFEKWAVFKVDVNGVFFEKKGADSGIDGYFYISEYKNNKAVDTKCLIQVKSGKVSVKDIREFNHILDRENSPVGIFITLEEPTKPMFEEINTLPQHKTAFGNYEKIYIVKVEDFFNDNLPYLPGIKRATKQAQAVDMENIEQQKLL